MLQAVAVYGGSKSGKNPIFFEKATGIRCMIRYYSATFFHSFTNTDAFLFFGKADENHFCVQFSRQQLSL